MSMSKDEEQELFENTRFYSDGEFLHIGLKSPPPFGPGNPFPETESMKDIFERGNFLSEKLNETIVKFIKKHHIMIKDDDDLLYRIVQLLYMIYGEADHNSLDFFEQEQIATHERKKREVAEKEKSEEKSQRKKAESELKKKRKHRNGKGDVAEAYKIFKGCRKDDAVSLRQFSNWVSGKNVPTGWPGISNLSKLALWANNQWDGPERKRAEKERYNEAYAKHNIKSND